VTTDAAGAGLGDSRPAGSACTSVADQQTAGTAAAACAARSAGSRRVGGGPALTALTTVAEQTGRTTGAAGRTGADDIGAHSTGSAVTADRSAGTTIAATTVVDRSDTVATGAAMPEPACGTAVPAIEPIAAVAEDAAVATLAGRA
jgi:hypothetical protein